MKGTPAVTDRITILLADDHRIVREGLKKLLESESAFQVVGEADNGRDVVALSRELDPSIVLMDIAMPVLNGIETATHLKKSSSPAKVIFLTIHNDSDSVGAAFKSGAEGYVFKTRMAADLIVAVREVLAGRTFLSS